jgi:perosamine synthetase
MLKLFKPFMSDEAIVNVTRVLRSGMLAEGPEVKAFEKELEEKLGKKNIVTLNSGTSALELAFELAGIEEGDEVITPILTCTATNLPLIHRKAKIVFTDIERDLNISVEDVKNKITDKTKAIVFVHFGGNNRGLDSLVKLCNSQGIILVEDAAQAIASDNWGKADFTCVSLQAVKTITSGDGGFLICKDDEHYKKARKLRWFGYDREKRQIEGDVDLDLAGYKYHMSDITASIGRGNLLHLDEIKTHIKALGQIYKQYGLYSHIWLAGGFTDDYKGLQDTMRDAGYEVDQHHYRNDKYTVFGGVKQNLPVMDSIENKYFFVPLHMGVTEQDAHNIGEIYIKCTSEQK